MEANITETDTPVSITEYYKSLENLEDCMREFPLLYRNYRYRRCIETKSKIIIPFLGNKNLPKEDKVKASYIIERMLTSFAGFRNNNKDSEGFNMNIDDGYKKHNFVIILSNILTEKIFFRGSRIFKVNGYLTDANGNILPPNKRSYREYEYILRECDTEKYKCPKGQNWQIGGCYFVDLYSMPKCNKNYNKTDGKPYNPVITISSRSSDPISIMIETVRSIAELDYLSDLGFIY